MNRTVDNVIKQYINKYHNPDATRRDVMMALNMYQSLVPKQEQYVFNDGSTIDLLNLDGTIPVTYKGTVYHIPVCIWLMDTHPNNAPICYIKPTSDMKIRVSMFVDHNGKIYLPYLHDWVPHSSDLLGLIQVMIVTFGDMPPVYSVKSTVDLAYPKSSYMPQPGAGTNQSYLPYPPTFNQPAASYGSGYPPYPPTSTPSYPPYPTYNYSTPYPPAMPPSISTYENPFLPDTSEQPRPTENPFAWSTPAGPRATGTITEEHIRASLLSAVEDKLKRRMKEQLSQAQAELDTLRRTNQELSQGKSRLDDIFIRLEKEKAELDKNITILQDKENELLEGLERLTDEDEIDVDEAVTTTAPIYKQLLIAFAEEAATEDAIYYMGEALRRGAIDLDVFLKQVRALSRKQFMLRALMQKCRQKAGLAG